MNLSWRFAKHPPSLRQALKIVAVLAGLNALLAVSLAWTALRPRSVIVVPGVPTSSVVSTEEIPVSSVRKFALLYLATFDNYTPSTVEDRSNYLLRFITPERLETVAKALSERASFALRARESSQLVLPRPESCAVDFQNGGRIQAGVRALRRVYVAGEVKEEKWITYTLLLRRSTPTDDDPFGFVVVEQSLEVESPVDDGMKAAEEKPDAHR